jgi:hypothetical protein
VELDSSAPVIAVACHGFEWIGQGIVFELGCLIQAPSFSFLTEGDSWCSIVPKLHGF